MSSLEIALLIALAAGSVGEWVYEQLGDGVVWLSMALKIERVTGTTVDIDLILTDVEPLKSTKKQCAILI